MSMAMDPANLHRAEGLTPEMAGNPGRLGCGVPKKPPHFGIDRAPATVRCEENPVHVATVECQSCEAKFCQECFDATHASSRVLAKHKPLRLNPPASVRRHVIVAPESPAMFAETPSPMLLAQSTPSLSVSPESLPPPTPATAPAGESPPPQTLPEFEASQAPPVTPAEPTATAPAAAPPTTHTAPHSLYNTASMAPTPPYVYTAPTLATATPTEASVIAEVQGRLAAAGMTGVQMNVPAQTQAPATTMVAAPQAHLAPQATVAPIAVAPHAYLTCQSQPQPPAAVAPIAAAPQVVAAQTVRPQAFLAPTAQTGASHVAAAPMATMPAPQAAETAPPKESQEDDSFFAEMDLEEICASQEKGKGKRPATDQPLQFMPVTLPTSEEFRGLEEKHIRVLSTQFGHHQFKALQWQIINAVLSKQDVCCVMATGYGKSLCFQFPPVFLGQTAVVVCPLISLMQDQVMFLDNLGIASCFLGSAQPDPTVYSRAVAGEFSLVYLTPEWLESSGGRTFFESLHAKSGISLIAVDEAHCISQWGHDFRTAYRTVHCVRDWVPNVPILALTATATPQVVEDIVVSLKLRSPFKCRTSFDRANLHMSVFQQGGSITGDLMKEFERRFNAKGDLAYVATGPTIVYCLTRAKTEEVAAALQTLGLKCAAYHAGLAPEVRTKVHSDFMTDRVQCISATTAFGMGINKPDVRKVIHYGAAKDIESYYQEMGRAGRDGQKSHCVTYYSSQDRSTAMFFLNKIQNLEHRKRKMQMTDLMQNYLTSTFCRRRLLLSFFGEGRAPDAITVPGGGCQNCDNCVNPPQESKLDIAPYLFLLLDCIFKCKSKKATGVVVQVLRGSDARNNPTGCTRWTCFGKGNAKSAAWWKEFILFVTAQGYVSSETVSFVGYSGKNITYRVPHRTSKGDYFKSKYKKNKTSLDLTVPRSLMPKIKRATLPKPQPIVTAAAAAASPALVGSGAAAAAAAVPAGPVLSEAEQKAKDLQDGLYRKLIEWRAQLMAKRQGLGSHHILVNQALTQISELRPSTLEALKPVLGFTEFKIKEHGADVIRIVTSYCAEKGAPTDQPSASMDFSNRHTLTVEERLLTVPDSAQISTRLFFNGKSIKEISSQRGLAESTIGGHLTKACKLALIFMDTSRLGLTDAGVAAIREASKKLFESNPDGRLAPIFEVLDEKYTYNQIRAVVLNEWLRTAHPNIPEGPVQIKPFQGTVPVRKRKSTTTTASQKRKVPRFNKSNSYGSRGNSLL